MTIPLSNTHRGPCDFRSYFGECQYGDMTNQVIFPTIPCKDYTNCSGPWQQDVTKMYFVNPYTGEKWEIKRRNNNAQ